MEIKLRPFLDEDAEDLLRVHYSAVNETAASHYNQDTRQQWSQPVGPERVATYLRQRDVEEQLTVVALRDEAMVGFATLVPANKEVRAVYVSHSCGRLGVGSQLLGAVEQLARGRGLSELHLDSSLNAEAFYLAHGYGGNERHVIELRSGVSIETVRMSKVL